MWIDRLTSSRTTQAAVLAAQFAEQRHRVLAENLANIDTPGYLSRRLDPAAFQVSLADALADARRSRETRLELRGNAQFAPDSGGGYVARPVTEPAPNALFHDGTNARLEGLLGDIAGNTLSYDLATNLLRERFEGLLTAIRGRVR